MRDTVVYNGYVLSDFFEVIDVGNPMSGRVNNTKQVSGMDGVLLTGSTMNPVSIPVTFMLSEMDMSERRERLRELAYMIRSKEPTKLQFGRDHGLYYMAVPDGDFPISDHVRSEKVVVTFKAQEPMLYGAERRVTVPSGGTVRVSIGGTYPTGLTITGDVYGDQTAGNVWGVMVDDAEFLRLELGGTSQRHVLVDCDKRYAEIDTAVTLPTMDSDWLRLDAGVHTIENDVGSGSVVVSWHERWL